MNEITDWVEGAAVERSLTQMGRLSLSSERLRSLLPSLATGRLTALVSDAHISNTRPTPNGLRLQGAGAPRTETKTDWIVPAQAWEAVDRDELNGNLGSFEAYFPGASLEDFVSLAFLDRTDKVLVRATGVRFGQNELSKALGEDIDIDGNVVPTVPKVPERSNPTARHNSGRKADALRWEQFAAALAVLFESGELDLSSGNKAHGQVATFLAKRGHEDALGVDTVRSLLLRLQAWGKGNPFADDADYPGN